MGVNPVKSQSALGLHRTLAGAMAFLADAVGFVWEITEQTGARAASPHWHQRFVPANPLKRATVKHAAPRSHQCQHGTVSGDIESHWAKQRDGRQLVNGWAETTAWFNSTWTTE